MIQNYAPGPTPAYRVASVDHALQLSMLLWQSRTLRVSDAAEYLGVARSTAHRLLAMLVFRGFARQLEGSHLYVPGPVLSEAGSRAMSQLEIQRRAQPFLHRLADATGETATLQTLDGRQVAFVDTVLPANAVRVGSRTGLTLPAHTSAGGKVLLAQLDEDEIQRLYPAESTLEQITPSSAPPTRETLLRELREIRRTGRAIDIRPAVVAAGVPVIGRGGQAVAALAVAAPRARTGKETVRALVDELQSVSSDLSEALAA
ncbi:IclR family transcriptional regulator [Microbacterium sp. NPDC096154]|uniref:IclR family transcriptional regulator n=1 Tax=Microbacterium sp. NPDC096154 TaxID=3155549 RepID=UPI00331A58BA